MTRYSLTWVMVFVLSLTYVKHYEEEHMSREHHNKLNEVQGQQLTRKLHVSRHPEE